MKRHNDIQHNDTTTLSITINTIDWLGLGLGPRPKPKKGKPKPRPKKRLKPRPRPRALHVKTQFSLSAMVSVEDNSFESK